MSEPLALLTLDDSTIVLRRARDGDLAAIVGLLADDEFGAARDTAGPDIDLAPYRRALEVIDADPTELLIVADDAGAVVGTFQLSILPGMSRRGALRGLIEAVRVRSDRRSMGLGAAMIGWAIEESRRNGCATVELTSNSSRVDARRFYERLGFVASHVGLKLAL